MNPSAGVLGRSVGEGVLLPDLENGKTKIADLYAGGAGLVPTPGSNEPMYFTVTLGAPLTSAGHLQLRDVRRERTRRTRLHCRVGKRDDRSRVDERRDPGDTACQRTAECKSELHVHDQQCQWRRDHLHGDGDRYGPRRLTGL